MQQPEAKAAKTSRGDTRFIGAWKLLSLERYSGGKLVAPHAGQTGILMYDASGWMSVQITPPPGQSAIYNAYFGPYEVKENEGAVIHHVEAAANPAFATKQVRYFAFEGKRLSLSTSPNADADQQTVLVWDRIE